MAIVLEGHNFAGKTTLANRLAKEHLLYTKTTNRDGSQFAVQWALLGSVVRVIDRSWVSEQVYSAIENRDTVITKTGLWSLLLQAAKSNSIFVQLSCSEEELEKRFHERGRVTDDLHKCLLAKKIYDQYEWPFGIIPKRCISVESVLESIDSSLEKTSAVNNHCVAGSVNHGKILLVCAEPVSIRCGVPFVSNSDYSTTGVLYSILESCGLTPFDVAICYSQTEKSVSTLVEILKPRKIITLGSAAAKLLTGTGIQFSEFEDPRYIFTFRFNRTYEFPKKLKEILQ